MRTAKLFLAIPRMDLTPRSGVAAQESAALTKAKLGSNVACERALDRFLGDRLALAHELPCLEQEDYVCWFLPKRADAAINRWLQSSRLSVLTPLSPQGTGCLLLTRERIDHVRQHRANQQVGPDAVRELLQALFVAAGASFSQNQSMGARAGGYAQQLMMFRDSYKSRNPQVAGQSPAAVIGVQFVGPVAALKLETAYWMRSRKAEALRRGALQ